VKKPVKLRKAARGFVRDYVETENATEAAARNYNVKDRRVAQVIGAENLSKPIILSAIEEERQTLKGALEAAGVTPDFLAKKVKQLLTDKKDYQAVDKGLTHATRIYGVTDDAKKNLTGNTYNILFAAETQETVKAFEEKLKEKMLGYVPEDKKSDSVEPERPASA